METKITAFDYVTHSLLIYGNQFRYKIVDIFIISWLLDRI